MNSARRKRIDGFAKNLGDLTDMRTAISMIMSEMAEIVNNKRAEVCVLLDDIKSRAEDLKSEIEEVRDEEQEFHDNMPEGFQQGEKGEAAEAAVNSMEEAISNLEDLVEFDLPDFELHQDEVQEVIGKIDDARTSLEEATGG